MHFKVHKSQEGSLARTGTLTTPHGEINTPVFMPVGTQGIVKTLAPWEVEEIGAEIILANTYHLHLRPGEKLIKKLGGLHQWSKWPGPILTDSGGYQAYSLGETRGQTAKTTDEGVKFSSHLDGTQLFFTPENVLDIQADIDSDIAMVLDDCPPIEATKERVAAAVERTGEWAKKSITHWQEKGMGQKGRAIFGIIQGGLHQNLRLKSMEQIQSLPFDGVAVGGVAIESEGKDLMNQAVDTVAAHLDNTRPHYLMGVGEPVDLIRMIHRGMDMFDCVIPTRYARHGSFWVKQDFKRLSITNAEYTEDDQPLDPDCSCKICQTFSRSYLRHLYMSNETFALRALSYHNLYLLTNLIKDIRESIDKGEFVKKYQSFLD
jgi:queuine tRNA-ribosyltransferase